MRDAATGGAAVEGIAQKFDEFWLLRVLGAEFAEGNVAAVVLRSRSVAKGAAKGAVQFLALDRVSNHGSFRKQNVPLLGDSVMR